MEDSLVVVVLAILWFARCPYVSALQQEHTNKKWHLKRNLNSDSFEDSIDGDQEYYNPIYSDDTATSACIQVKNGVAQNGNKLILGEDCSTEDAGWRGHSNGSIQSALTNDGAAYCMQAGHSGPAKSGEFVRLYDCDEGNRLQKFVFVNGGGIRPKYHPNLCIVWRGVHANIGKDPLILKACDEVDDRNDWSGDPFPTGNESRSPCVDPNVPEFWIDDNLDIGDTLYRPGPAFAEKCGPDCYTVKDNGDDPPYDPELGDTLRFAYKQITSNAFSIQSRVCGVDCDNNGDETARYFGRTGLMIRDGLDPLDRNVFVSHSPDGQADWSYRSTLGGETHYNFDGSPDVSCLWISLQRSGNAFSFSYAYEGTSECEMDRIEDLDQTIEIEMPETVYVGLAVSTAVSPPHCRYTKADFNDIECRGC